MKFEICILRHSGNDPQFCFLKKKMLDRRETQKALNYFFFDELAAIFMIFADVVILHVKSIIFKMHYAVWGLFHIFSLELENQIVYMYPVIFLYF